MAMLNAAQRQWLNALGVMVGRGPAALEAPPEEAVSRRAPAEPGANVKGDAKARAKAEAPGKARTVEAMEDRRREFKRARAQWVAVKQRAEEDLEKVKDGARHSYLEDAEQFPKIEAGCAQIDRILDSLDDELRDTLDRYAATPLRKQKELAALGRTAAEILSRYRTFVAGNKLMRAIDEGEFADVKVHAPVMKALKALEAAIV